MRYHVAAICAVAMLCAVCCAQVDAQQDDGAPRLRKFRAVKLSTLPQGATGATNRSQPQQTPPQQAPPQQTPPLRQVQANETPQLTPIGTRSPGRTPTVAVTVPPIERAVTTPGSRAPQTVVRQAAGVEPLDNESVLVPLATEPTPENVQFKTEQGLVELIAPNADLKSVLRMIADYHGLNLVLGPDVQGPVSVSIRGARMEEVLDAILGVAGFSWHRVDNLLYVTNANTAGMDPRVQGRTLNVYPLNYVAAEDVEAVANGLLSPAGHVYVTASDSNDQLRTREVLVVEDVPAAHNRIAQYIAQIDVPPRQVLVEAHVLQIALSDDERHGIDLKALARVDGSAVTIEGSGFADQPNGSDPSVTLSVNGTDMDNLVELIREHTNSRTLASPKLSVVNHQEAKIQIGQRLPYSVATTTQTSTVQSVEYLEVGIVLTVRPVITADGNIMMSVLPKVSGGKITSNGFPEEETTEVSTTILMPNGGGVIIGGLIREGNVQTRAFVPYFGRVPVLGSLFRRRTDEMRRNELVIALVAHTMPDGYGPRIHEADELEDTLPNYASRELIYHPAPVVEYEE